MKRIFALLHILAAAAGLAACGRSGRPGAPVSQTPDVSSGETQSDAEAAFSNILIAYVPDSGADTIQNSAALLQQTLGGELYEIGSGDAADASRYEYVLLGFQAENSVLPQPVEAFLQDNNLGARTIYPFVSGNGNDSDAVFAAISQLQPGALLGNTRCCSRRTPMTRASLTGPGNWGWGIRPPRRRPGRAARWPPPR